MSSATHPTAGKEPGLQLQVRLKRQGFTLDIDLQLPGRGITALFGASGSGKTTCLRVLAGLAPQARGRVCVQGELWQDSTLGVFCPVHRRALGYVFQEASLFEHLNVQDNVKFGFRRTPAPERRHGWDHALALLGIAHLLQRWPHELSGGERQRVAIARALAASPRILLMDEPLAALDARRKAEILPYLERLHSELDIPVLYVSHALDEVARLADHLVLLEAGRVTASGPTAELMTRLDLPLAHGDSAGAVLTVTVRRHDPDEHLTTASFSGGNLSVPMQAAGIGQSLRIRVQARDVSLTLARQTGTSILNIIAATVTALTPDSPGQVMVALDAGGCPLLARVTTRSAHALGLAPGLALFAQIKGVAILG
ncbi:MAG: molybdenum ABC transporter ATP-binding protein [Rhodoferax sp.]|nr:molybdenum ABC transporter ATP-binding protein [Rhodoferax sp.]